MPGPFRSTDAVLTITQNNNEKSISISAVNENAAKLLGVDGKVLVGTALENVVSPKVKEALHDYVEFEAGANDVGQVLRRIRDFRVKNAQGKEIPLKLKVERHNSSEFDEFMLIMHDEIANREFTAAVAAMHRVFWDEGTKYPDTELTDRATLERGLQVVDAQREKIPNGVSLAVVELDGAEELIASRGIGECHEVLKAVAHAIQQNLRGNDVIAQYDDRRLVVVLIGAGAEASKIVLNRLRWLIGGVSLREGGKKGAHTVSVAYNEIGAASAVDLLPQLIEVLASKPKDTRNVVIEA